MTTSSKPALTREQVHEVLWKLAAEQLDKSVDSLKPTDRLIQDLGADSLQVVEISMELESKLGITIADEDLDNANLTLGDVEQVICAKCL